MSTAASEQPRHGKRLLPIVLGLWAGLLHASGAAAQAAPEIPFVPGLVIGLAVHATGSDQGTAQGDYEILISVDSANAKGITVTNRTDAKDGRGNPLRLKITRRVSSADLDSSRVQVLGFDSEDPLDIPGTTLLGPSLAIMRELRTLGRAEYSVHNYYAEAVKRKQEPAKGTLVRAGATPVSFPVLVNGRRVQLPAVRVTGQLTVGGRTFPWEQVLLDHPTHPLTLRWAYGQFGEGIPFTPRAFRDVIRIDFPAPAERDIETALSTNCRVEMPGIYFDFDQATLKPESNRAMRTIADLLQRQQQWRLTIEGHTDNIGSDAYNQTLSMRRAATVKASLEKDYTVSAARLTSAGFGARRPVETNDTMAGRARNRRVELVRDCAQVR